MNATQTATTVPEQPLAAAAETAIPDVQPRARAQDRTGTQTATPEPAQIRTTPPQPARVVRPSNRRRGALLLAALLLATAAAALGGRWWLHASHWVKTDNAYVSARVHTVSARVAGTLKQVLVEENQLVNKGALLARLDPADFDVRCRQATAQAAQAQAQTRQAEARIAQAQAGVARETARAEKAALDLSRADSLYHVASGAISRQEFDQAKTDAAAAQAGLQAAQAEEESARALALAAKAQEKSAEANLQDAQLQRSYTELTAPVTGRIGRKNLETGNRVQPGQALLAMVEPEVWVTANFKETQLEGIVPGRRAEVEFDAFPGRRFAGRVDSLCPASGAQFALLPPDNATGNFTRIVQRVPVKITLDSEALGNAAGRVVPGMSAIVEVKVRE